MYKATVDGFENPFSVEFEETKKAIKGKVNEVEFDWNMIEKGNGNYHLIYNHKSYNINVLELNRSEKIACIKINNNLYNIKIEDKFDLLLKKLGMENLNNFTVKELKAPMPGLVLELKVNVGDTVAKGDNILILEAMKMENIIKSPSEGRIASIKVQKGQAVEKNQLLISFE
jgi:biotin carboxyl carrier protein